jgi:pilus assembly protein CpaF
MQGMPMQGVPLAPQGIQGLPMQGLPMQGAPMQGMPMQGMPMTRFVLPEAGQAPVQGAPMHNAPMQSAPMQLAQLQAAQIQAAQLQAAQLASNPQLRPGGGFVSAPGAQGSGAQGMLPVVRVPGGAPAGGPSQAQVAAAQMQAQMQQQQAQQRAQAQMQQQQPGAANLPPVAGPPQRGARPTTGSVSLPMPRGRNLSPEMLERRRRDVELRRGVHKILLEHLDLATMDPSKLDDPSIRPRVLNALRRIIGQLEQAIPPDVDRDQLVGELADEALGLGPLERFLSDPSITEIMVVDPETIYVEKGGRLMLSDARFTDDDRVRAVIERIVTPLGRRIDESSPIVDARLRDGSRVNAIIRPLALRGSCITIRKFARTPLTLERLIELGTLTPPIARFLTRSVIAKKNVVISGGTGSGKTTLLNVLSGAIPAEERIVTIEDAAELQLKQPHVVSLETRPANLEGRGEYTIRDLVKNALRMRPDRIVVGECRGGEALDMLQAMNTGHDGSLTTTHANTPHEAVARLETLSLMSGLDLPSRAIREQIGSSIHLIVQQSRLSDGSRKITAISEVVGVNDEGEVELRPIFEFVRTGTGAGGKVIGEFRATGYLPSYLQEFIVMGLVAPGESYL